MLDELRAGGGEQFHRALGRGRVAKVGVGEVREQAVEANLRLGARVLEIPAGEKARYHAAAVIASNFPVVLLAMATRLLTLSGIQENSARGALSALLSAAALSRPADAA